MHRQPDGKVGNIPKGQTPKYEDMVDLSFANESIKELGEVQGAAVIGAKPTDDRTRTGARADPAPCLEIRAAG